MDEINRRTYLRAVAAGATGLALGATPTVAAQPSGSGSTATWTTAEQYGIGTVQDHAEENPSRVWYSLTEGACNGLRFPRIDMMNVRTVDVVVADPDDGYVARSFNVDRTDDDTSTIERSTEPAVDDALLFEQTIEETGDRDWQVTVQYATDPAHDAFLADIEFEADGDYDVYVVVDAAVSNSGKADVASRHEITRPGKSKWNRNGRDNGREKDSAHTGFVLTAYDDGSNDGDAVILNENGEPYNVALAVDTARGFDWATVDVVGGDSLSPLLTEGGTDTTYEEASGNVALVGQVASSVNDVRETIAIGFATEADVDVAREEARDALGQAFPAAWNQYRKSWRQYLNNIEVPDSVQGNHDLRAQYNFAAMCLKAADSKQFPGAGVASLSIPWGDGVTANEPSDYGYHYTWARDLYHAFTAMEAMGDVDSALEATEYIYEHQQGDDGFIPQNTFVDGRTRWGGEQMDNISFPQIMAYQLRRRHGVDFDDTGYNYGNVKASADYVVANGPFTGQERWEEEGGLSPSTTAAEIAGLVCAGELAAESGAIGDALAYFALADRWQANTEEWMATETGTDQHENTPYFFRINDDRDPDDGATVNLNNGGPTLDERNVIDASFLELVRLGVKHADDPVIENSVSEVDDTIRVDTPNGPGWYRYNGDGYGEQGQNPKDDYPAGAPWSLDNAGQGRLWPIFSGERAEYELRRGTDDGPLAPANLLETMARFGNSGLMIPEQVWDRPEPTEFGWEFGEGTGSATPLSWSMAQYVRLAHALDERRPVETPAAVEERYAEGERTGGPELDVEFPPTFSGDATVTVSGTTDGDTVVVKTPAETLTVTPDGEAFSTEVTIERGEQLLTVVAATGDDPTEAATTLAQQPVSFVDVGDLVAEFDDSVGDDHGPGSYTYPTANVFQDGVFDIDTFSVYETADTYQFVTELAGPLTNPWGGNEFSLQTFQIYVRQPGESGGSTVAREGVNATFEVPYHYRVFAEGFVAPRVEAADGSEITRDVSVTGFQSLDTVLIEVPKSAIGGSLDGAAFVPLLLGQDGYSPGRIRPVTGDGGGYTFGGGAGGGTRDSNDPNVIDLVTSADIPQAEALAYTEDERATIPYVEP